MGTSVSPGDEAEHIVGFLSDCPDAHLASRVLLLLFRLVVVGVTNIPRRIIHRSSDLHPKP